MNIEINAVKFRTDEKLENFITDKVSKFEKLFDQITKCEVSLKLDKPESENNKLVDMRLHVPGYDLFVSKRADSFEEATLQAIESMKLQVNKHKEKLRG